MKTLFVLAAGFLSALASVSRAQAPTTTYVVIKATASIPGVYQDATAHLAKTTITTKMLINMALGRDVSTAIDPNVILGYAFDFAGLGQHNPTNPAGKAQLVVFQVDPGNQAGGTKLKSIGAITSRSFVENQVFNKFRRALTSQFVINDSGGTSNRIFGGTLVGGGIGTRKPDSPDPATVATVTITAPMNLTGYLNLSYTKAGQPVLTNNVVVVTKGAVVGKGKIVGSFTE